MVFVGRVTKDAVVAELKNEKHVVNFTVAVNDSYKPKGSDRWETITTYFSCAYWLSTKVAERLKKGNIVEIIGRLSINAYNDMQGNAKASLNCHVDLIKIHQQMKSTESTPQFEKKGPVMDDLPF